MEDTFAYAGGIGEFDSAPEYDDDYELSASEAVGVIPTPASTQVHDTANYGEGALDDEANSNVLSNIANAAWELSKKPGEFVFNLTHKPVETAKAVGSAAVAAGAGVATAVPSTIDDIDKIRAAIFGGERWVHAEDWAWEQARKVAPSAVDYLQEQAKENPAIYTLAQMWIPGGFAGKASTAMTGAIAARIAGKYGKVSGKVGDFVKGLNMDTSLATASTRGAISVSAGAGIATRGVAESIVQDAMLAGWWGTKEEQDGSVHFDVPAIGQNIVVGGAVGGILNGFQYSAMAKRVRISLMEANTAGARQAFEDLWDAGYYAQFGDEARLVADATEYLTLQKLQHESALAAEGAKLAQSRGSFSKFKEAIPLNKDHSDTLLGQAYKNYKKNMWKTLGLDERFMESPAGSQLFDYIHQTCFMRGGSEFRTPYVRNAKAIRKSMEAAKKSDVAAQKFAKLEEEAIYLNKKTGEIIDQTSTFGKDASKVGDDIIEVRFKRHVDPDASAYLIRAGQERSATLTNAANDSFVTAQKEYLPELTGTASELTESLVQNYGKVDTKAAGLATAFVPWSQKAKGDPVRSTVGKIGSIADRMRAENKITVINRLKPVQKLLKKFDSDKAVQEGVDDFGRIDAARRKGFDVYEGSTTFRQDADGTVWNTIRVKDTERNRELYQSLGIDDPEEFGWALPDAKSYFNGEGSATPLEWKAGGIGDEIYNAINGVERELTAAKKYAGMLDPSLDTQALRANYTRMLENNPDQLARVIRKGKPGTEREYATFPNEESARKFLINQKQAGDTSWSDNIAVGTQEFADVVGKNMVDRYIDMERTTGGVRGHFGGNMHQNSKEWLQSYMERQVHATDSATDAVIGAAFRPVMRQTNAVLPKDVRDELKNVLTGRLPDIPIFKELNAVMDKAAAWAHGWGKAMQDPKPQDLLSMVPNSAPKPLRVWLQKFTNHVSLAQYSALNLGATVQNYLSVLQSNPTTMQWYRALKGETAEQYATRTGIALEDGARAGVGYLDQFRIGTRAMKRFINFSEEDKALLQYARASGVLNTEVDDVVNFYNPFREPSLVTQALTKASWLTRKSEEHSRVVAVLVGDQYAKDVLKLTGKARKNFALNFAEESIGRFDPLHRVGLANYPATQSFTMFQTYAHNQMLKNLDFILAGDQKAYWAANLTNMMLFGARGGPFASLLVSRYSLDDESKQNLIFDGGIDAVVGLGVGKFMQSDEAKSVTNLKSPPPFNFIRGAYRTINDLMAGWMTDPSLWHVAEVISTEAPYTAVRRVAQTLMGYSVTGEHSLLYDTRDMEGMDWWIGKMRLASGIMPYKEQAINSMNRMQRAQEANLQDSKKRASEVLAARARHGDDFSDLAATILRLYGYDAQAAAAAMLNVIQNSSADAKERYLRQILENPKKITDLEMFAVRHLLED